jgi:predicted dehydrogenase
MKTALPRRAFLKQAAVAAVAPLIVPASVFGAEGRPAPSNRINCAVIGLGDRGSQHTGALAGMPDAQVLAVCDVYRSKGQQWKTRVDAQYAKAAAAGDYQGCTATQDFREVIARKDIDAVIITAPENWHVLLSIAAMRAGKDVYCEKALSLTVAEGRAVCEAVRRYGRVFQIGTQQRSERGFRFACELARNGYLGKVHTVNVSVPGGRSLPVAQPSAPPPDLDYEMWLGPAPWSAYNDNKCTYNWYFMSDYCAGWIQSWGVHHIDIALWGQPMLMDSTLEIEGSAVFPTEGQANTSINWNVEARPKRGPKLVFTDDKNGQHGVRFIGDKGWVHVVRGNISAGPEELLEVRLKSSDLHLYESNNHMQNFLDCIKSRRDPVAPVEGGHAATTFTLVADIATRLQRKLLWDWKAERFINDPAANTMLSRTMRTPWTI